MHVFPLPSFCICILKVSFCVLVKNLYNSVEAATEIGNVTYTSWLSLRGWRKCRLCTSSIFIVSFKILRNPVIFVSLGSCISINTLPEIATQKSFHLAYLYNFLCSRKGGRISLDSFVPMSFLGWKNYFLKDLNLCIWEYSHTNYYC